MRSLNINKQAKPVKLDEVLVKAVSGRIDNGKKKKKVKDERGEAYARQDNARAYIAPRVLPGQSTRKENYTDEEYAADRREVRAKADKNPLNSWNPKEFLNPKNLTRENVSTVAQGLESQFRVSDKPNFFDDYVNPANMLGQMASNLGTAPLQAKKSNSNMPYVTALGTPLITGALGGVGAKSTGQFVDNVVNPLAGFVGTPEQAKKIGNLVKTQFNKVDTPTYNLLPSEIKLLSSVRNIGSISKKSRNLINDLNALQGIRKNIDHITDEQFKNLTGYPKAGLDERIAILKDRAENSSTSIPQSQPSRAGVDDDIDEFINANRRRRAAERESTSEIDGIDVEVSNTSIRQAIEETLERLPNRRNRINNNFTNDSNWTRLTDPVANTVNESPTKLANSKATLRNNFSRNQPPRPTFTDNGFYNDALDNLTFEDFASARNLSNAERRRISLVARMKGIDLDNLGNHYTAFNKLDEIHDSKSLLERLNTVLENRFSKELPETTLEPHKTTELLPVLYQNLHTDVNKELIKAVNQVRNAKKGESFIPSYSLSSDSFKASVRLLNKVLDEDIVDVSYHGRNLLNDSGFSQKAGLPLDLSFKEMNFDIQNLNKKLKEKGFKELPFGESIKSVDDGDNILGIEYPTFTVTRKKLGGHINSTKNNTMTNYVNNKKMPKAVYGALISAGVGMVSNIISSNKAKQQQKEDAEMQLKLMNAQKFANDSQVAQNFDEQGSQINSLYMDKGGKLSQASYNTLGGELKPLSSNTELVKGNTHESNAIDGVNGVKLIADGEPIAEVENEEVIKDGQKVYSDTLKPDGSSKTYAELVKVLTKKKGKEEERVQGLVHRVKDNTAKRNIEKLNIEEDRLFAQQEQDKLRKGIETPTTDSQVEKGIFGLDLEALDSAVTDAKAEGAGHVYGGGAFGQYVAPFVDNVSNLVNTLSKPKVPKPAFLPTQTYNTKVNVTDKIANVNNAVESSSDFIKRNSSNSNTARGNMIGARLQGAGQINSLLVNKENQERDLENRALQEQSRTTYANANLLNNFNSEKLERKLDIRKEISDNVGNAVDDYGKGVQYRDSIELDKEKNALYERISSGDNKNLAARTKTINPSQIREWQNNPEEFQSYYEEIMSDPTTDESTKRKLDEVYRKLFMKPSYANFKI